jgi:signal transduction histidine kinase
VIDGARFVTGFRASVSAIRKADRPTRSVLEVGPEDHRTQVTPQEATLRIHNKGVPVPPDKLPVLFEPLQRATGQTDLATRSVGLGLYIVKQIVEAHHGSVAVQSTEAEGTLFTVTLPRVAAARAIDA